ncbi:hypothetical protein D4L85_25025 [Chryseolinea soli]|uniref:Uncharacterized protein n=1 Tax=Chryseolinea soli TaxID=2321403 RepID=A0A385SRY0_9BACT|nr:hypothetical protein D4L85_25025 [Chryseolinea soli]
MRHIFLTSFLIVTFAVNAQRIVYDLPKSVVKKIDQHISYYPDSAKFVILFESIEPAKYRIAILNDFSNTPNFKDIDETLVQQTSRFIRVNDLLIPMITSEDFLFADFGTVYTPETKSEARKVGKKKVVFTNEEKGITFDASGHIF